MSAGSLKIANREFVILSRREFLRMQRESERYRLMSAEDRALGRLAEKELKSFRKGGSKGTPWAHVKKELGL